MLVPNGAGVGLRSNAAGVRLPENSAVVELRPGHSAGLSDDTNEIALIP